MARTTTLSVRLGETALPLLIRHHPRARRLILRLAADGSAVHITVPPFASEGEALAFAARASPWLTRRLAALPRPVPFVLGSVVPLRGSPCVIVAGPASRDNPITAGDGQILIARPSLDLPQRLGRWLRQEAKQDLLPRALDKADRIGRPLGRVAVRDPVSRWGSCSASGNLSFSWRLVLAPPAVLDYVVAHEVAHLAVRNHGPRFWAVVRELTADADQARDWLRREGPALHRYGRG